MLLLLLLTAPLLLLRALLSPARLNPALELLFNRFYSILFYSINFNSIILFSILLYYFILNYTILWLIWTIMLLLLLCFFKRGRGSSDLIVDIECNNIAFILFLAVFMATYMAFSASLAFLYFCLLGFFLGFSGKIYFLLLCL